MNDPYAVLGIPQNAADALFLYSTAAPASLFSAITYGKGIKRATKNMHTKTEHNATVSFTASAAN